jgi:catechol 2,3-dioxygenase-like lactoylglutathione lyase family enzyme
MKFKELTPMMETNDLQATIAFYTGVLGFEVRDTFEHDGKTVWCTLFKDAVDIMFNLPNMVMNCGRILLTGSLYIYVDDVNFYRIKNSLNNSVEGALSIIRGL